MLNTNQPESYPFQTSSVNIKQEDNNQIYCNYYPDYLNQHQEYYACSSNQYAMLYEDDAITHSNCFGNKNKGGRKQVKQGTTKRNARERNRVRYINNCFETLREHIPDEMISDEPKSPANRKLSKVETLKYASLYIKQLTELLQESENNTDENIDNNLNYSKRFKKTIAMRRRIT